MSREENPREDVHDLSEFEAALGALVPRAERLDRERLMFLAGQASVELQNSQPGTTRQSRARWAWPAACTTMTGIAAALLVALTIRPAPQVVERIVTVPAAPQEPVAAVVQGRVEPESEMPSAAVVAALPDWLAWDESFLRTHHAPRDGIHHAERDEYDDPQIRRRLLLHASEWREPPGSRSAAIGRADDEPVPYHEQLHRLLEELRNSSGARS
jgi:hypothetical protein